MGKQAKENDTIETTIGTMNLRVFGLVASIAILLVAASVIAIIYAKGGKPTQTGIVSTGNIRLNLDTNDFSVAIDGEPYQTQNKLINNLEPGTYTITVSKPGYYSWEKNVQVQADLVNDLFVRLIPEKLEPIKYTPLSINKIFFSKNGEYMYYVITDSDSGQDIGIWREKMTSTSGALNFLGSNNAVKITNLTDDIIDQIEAKNYNIIPSSDNKKIILTINGEKRQSYILRADGYEEPSAINTLENLVEIPYRSVRWLEKSNSLLLINDDLIAAYDLDSDEIHLIDYSPAETLAFSNSLGRVYFYDRESKALKYYLNKKTIELKLDNIMIEDEIVKLWSPELVNNIIYFQTSKGQFYFLDTNRSYLKEIVGVTSIDKISHSGLAAVAKEGEDSYLVVLDEVRALSSYEVKKVALDDEIIDSNIVANITYTPAGHGMLIFTTTGNLYLADVDGGNVQLLINTDEYEVNTSGYYINSDGSKLFVTFTEGDKDFLYELSL